MPPAGERPLGAFVAAPQARLLPPQHAALASRWRTRGREVFALQRRGVDFGAVMPLDRRSNGRAEALRRWRAGEPVFVPGALGDGPRRHGAAIRATLAMFERLRQGGDFLGELEARLAADDALRYAGSTIDQDDPREVERVFVDAEQDGAVVAENLWAKLAWIADDETDRSLRIRFSSGLEQSDAWLAQTETTACWVDEFAARAFPECDAVLASAPLQELLRALLQRPFRLGERIVYNNAPGGGAVFHHDAEPTQLGVVFSQLEGHTAWFAIGKQRLERLLVRHGAAADLRAARRQLDRGDQATWRVLNRDVAFAQRLAAHSALFVLQEGDSILLPSHGFDDVAWHSVFALGERPSLAHSYGLFARGTDR